MCSASPRSFLLALATLGCGCGSGPGAAPDGGATAEDVCGFGSDRFLPYSVGNSWTYEVTDLGDGARRLKDQRLDEEIEDPELGAVIVQLTSKRAGTTRSLFRVDGDRIVRLLQEDVDSTNTLERTTTYDPGQIRIDESPARLEPGATWEETYLETEVELGGAPVTVATVDAWEVIGTDVACESPLGTFECIHLRRTRAMGGVAVKDFFFARGVGKVREIGDKQLEELTACGR